MFVKIYVHIPENDNAEQKNVKKKKKKKNEQQRKTEPFALIAERTAPC
jgi:hypothetical protein